MIINRTILLTLFTLVCLCTYAQSQASFDDQSSFYDQLLTLPDKYHGRLQQKISDLSGKLDKSTDKYLQKLQKQEARIYKKLWRKDSSAAKELMGNVRERYASLIIFTTPATLPPTMWEPTL